MNKLMSGLVGCAVQLDDVVISIDTDLASWPCLIILPGFVRLLILSNMNLFRRESPTWVNWLANGGSVQ